MMKTLRNKTSAGGINSQRAHYFPQSATQAMPLHFGKTRPAIGAIDQAEECRHDRTPLLIIDCHPDRLSFPAVFATHQNWFPE
jgi:hypothetical protein